MHLRVRDFFMPKHTTSIIQSMTHHGIDCVPVEIEVHAGSGLPSVIIVGLPDAAVSESRDRVRSGIVNSGFTFPRTKLTINLAPAHIKKSGSTFDLPIALGILRVQDLVPKKENCVIVGELALDGRTRPVSGALIYAHAALQAGQTIIVPTANSAECALLNSDRVLFAETLQDVVSYFHGTASLPTAAEVYQQMSQPAIPITASYDDILGQESAKRAFLIAAAGAHNIILSGPPGAGKTILAKALPSILPPMSDTEIVETTKIHSIMNPGAASVRVRPFRSPHHLASSPAILGGGAHLRPGEISLAHHGVLFLDEFPEFRRDIIEALREPLESGVIHLTRAVGSVLYPADCMVVAAHNPCPCGTKNGHCVCSSQSLDRYHRKLSGPIMDRFDIKLRVQSIAPEELVAGQKRTMPDQSTEQKEPVGKGETEIQYSTAVMRDRVIRVREIQAQRGMLNSRATVQQLQDRLTNAKTTDMLDRALKSNLLSMRGYTKALRLAATIADIAESKTIELPHIAEAFRLTVRQE